MHVRSGVCIVAWCLLLSGLSPAQEVAFPAQASSVRVPLVMLSGGNYAGLPCIEAKVGDQTVLCMLDTGYNGMAIDRGIAQTLELTQRGQDVVFGIARAEKVKLYRGATFAFGGVEFEGGIMHGLRLEGFCGKRMRRVQALLGTPFFARVVVTIDYPNRSVVLSDPDAFERPESCIELPLKFALGQPELRAAIDDGRALRYLVDTGAEAVLILNAPFVARHRFVVDASKFPRTSMSGVSGFVHASIGRLQQFAFGSVRAQNVPVTMLAATRKAALGADQRRAGIIGSGMMANVRVTFDYARRRMLLENYADDLAPCAGTGLVVSTESDGTRQIGFVLSVPGRAPLDLLVHDVLVEIDGGSVPEDAREIYELLIAQPETTLTVARDGKRHDVVWPRLRTLPRAMAGKH